MYERSRSGLATSCQKSCHESEFAGERFTNCSRVARMIGLPNVDPKNVAIVGARGALNPPEEWDFVDQHGIRVYRMNELRGPRYS
jgi:agmatinase